MIENSHVHEYRIDNDKIEQSVYEKDYEIERKKDLQVQESKYVKPKYESKTKNKKNEQMGITKYNEVDEKWWEKIFPCCGEQKIEPDFEDCDYCQRRVYKEESESDEETPYISQNRMKQRSKQPIITFCDQLENNQILKTSWQNE